MALIISEPCRIWIDENIDDGLAEGKTPTAIGKEIASAIEKLFEVEVKPDTIRKRASRERQRRGVSDRTIVQPAKPTRKQTKPEVRSVLNEAVQAIASDQVSDADVKTITDTVAGKISSGNIAPEVAGPIKRAADKHRKPVRRKGGGPTTLQQVHTRLNGAANDLLGYLDAGIKPEGTDRTYYEGIRHVAPMLIMCFARMGINVEAVMATVTGTPKEISHVKTAKSSK